MSEEVVRVLVADDDGRIAELHRRFVVRLSGFEVVGLATRLEEAAEMVDILQPDLLLLDLFFPEGNGLDLLRQIRAGAQPCDVILVTAARDMATLQEGLRGGVFDYIIKPVHFPRLQEALESFRHYLLHSRSGAALEQQDIDRLLHPRSTPALPVATAVPKGIDPLTLTKIRQVFMAAGEGDRSAEEVAQVIGVSRSTARRYLEFLASEGFLSTDLVYGVVGRPERRYRRQS